MEILGSKKDCIKRAIEWEYKGDNTLVGKKLYSLSENPTVKIMEKEREDIIKLVKHNCYYEVVDLVSTITVPLKIGKSVINDSYMGKENYIPIKVSSIDNICYRIEVYDPIKSTVEFGAPLYAFDFYPDKRGIYGDNSSNNYKRELDKFIFVVSYILGRHYDLTINKMLYSKSIAKAEYCLNTTTNNILDIVNKDVLTVDINIKKLLIDFIKRARKNYKDTPKQSINLFGDFNIGLSPVQGNFLILRLDNGLNCVSTFLGKMLNNIKNNCTLSQFTVTRSFRDE